MDAASVVPAIIKNLDKGTQVQCLFAPKEYTLAKQNSWTEGKSGGKDLPNFQFGNGQAASLTMQLFFDTFEKKEDVRKKYTDAIWEMMAVDESLKDKKSKKGRPPRVQFLWGSTWQFEGVIASISQKFTLFLHDGTPVRATMDVTFKQIKDAKTYPKTNPTSGGEGGERVVTVVQGDTLAGIAYREYGDPTAWRPIADANRLTNVRRLTPGTVLAIPNG